MGRDPPYMVLDYAEWPTLEKFWEVRDFLAGVLGSERVLVSSAGFNAVGKA